ncbi:unnamed protein product, partial [Ectocarpus fasciculatus]
EHPVGPRVASQVREELLHRAPGRVQAHGRGDLRLAPQVRHRDPGGGHPQARHDFRGGFHARVRAARGHEAGLQRAHPYPEPGLAHGSARTGHGGHLRHRFRQDPGVLAPGDDPHQRTGLARVCSLLSFCFGALSFFSCVLSSFFRACFARLTLPQDFYGLALQLRPVRPSVVSPWHHEGNQADTFDVLRGMREGQARLCAAP